MAKRVKSRKTANIDNITPKDELIRKLGRRIKAARKAQGFTSYEHFAYDLDISRSMYGKYESGSDMRFSTLVKIIEGMGMKISDFFAEGFD